MAGRVQYPQDSDKRRLSSLFDSIRSGLGSSPKDDSVPLTSSASGGDPAQDRSVVQHVSCRRRRDSNSSSSSESGLGAAASSKRTSSTTSESASGSNQPKGQLTWQQNRSDTESTPNSPRSISLGGNTQTGSFSPGSVSFVSVVKDGQIKKSVEYKDSGSSSTLPETGDRPEMSRSVREIENRSENSVERPRKPSDQSQDVKPKNFGHNQDIGLTSAKPFELNQHYMLHAPHTSGRDDDQSSNCSFTSSEIGETTSSAPPELVLSSSPFHTTTEVSERPSSEVGQVSSSHSLGKQTSSNLVECKIPVMSKIPLRVSRSASIEAQEITSQKKKDQQDTMIDTSVENPSIVRSRIPQHITRQSSGRSETLSLTSVRTASPLTKVRLLDLASKRALDRDGSDSSESWSGTSDADTLSLGMSCSGMRDTPEKFSKSIVEHSKKPALQSREYEEILGEMCRNLLLATDCVCAGT